jgi:hypothetical protein
VEARTLLAYRRAELAVGRQCRGRVLCFAAAGAADATGDFVFSLANIMATDVDGRLLVIDGDATDPLSARLAARAAPPPADLIDCLRGGGGWRDAVVPAGGGCAFDLIDVRAPVTGERTRAFKAQELEALFAELLSHYRFVFVRALPEALFLENVALVAAASDLVVGVDARRTTFHELARTLTHLGEEKLRGLVLIGT